MEEQLGVGGPLDVRKQWLLVAGALGLEGVTELVRADQVAGLGDFINALLSMVAIAVGVLVGSGLSERMVSPSRNSTAL